MGTTPRFGYRYPDPGDEFNVALDMQQLASDVEAWSARAIPCLSSARPASPPLALMILETDTGDRRIWTGSSWELLAGAGGGGGGGGVGIDGITRGAYSATTIQSVPNDTVTACAFAGTDQSSAAVTRQTRGAGHEFKLGIDAYVTASTSVRFAASDALGERYVGWHWGTGTAGREGDAIKGQGCGTNGKGAVVHNVSDTIQVASGEAIYVQLYQGTGGTRPLEPGPDGATTGGWVSATLLVIPA